MVGSIPHVGELMLASLPDSSKFIGSVSKFNSWYVSSFPATRINSRSLRTMKSILAIYKSWGLILHSHAGTRIDQEEFWKCQINYIKPINSHSFRTATSILVDCEIQNQFCHINLKPAGIDFSLQAAFARINTRMLRNLKYFSQAAQLVRSEINSQLSNLTNHVSPTSCKVLRHAQIAQGVKSQLGHYESILAACAS